MAHVNGDTCHDHDVGQQTQDYCRQVPQDASVLRRLVMQTESQSALS